MADEVGVVSLALGPIIRGRRQAPVLRVRLDGNVFRVENKHGTLGLWRPVSAADQAHAAIQIMQQINARELQKRQLRLW